MYTYLYWFRLSLSHCLDCCAVPPSLLLRLRWLNDWLTDIDWCVYVYLLRSSRCRVICAESAPEPGVSRNQTDHRHDNSHHRHLHHSVPRRFHHAAAQGLHPVYLRLCVYDNFRCLGLLPCPYVARGICSISPPRFMTNCRMRRPNQG